MTKEKALAILDSQRTTNTVESAKIGMDPDLTTKLIIDFEKGKTLPPQPRSAN